MSSPLKLAPDVPLTIKDLLTSLHTHLQTQTQLLPTFHAQLGLPQSALIDDLQALNQRLASCVEDQIQVRREEVDNWMQKCDSIERECLKYAAALGGYTKTINASIGELRKQQVLPVRHEILNQHQEKLVQLYKKKLEQLTNLANRVATLAQTLGHNFFISEIVELPADAGTTPANGQSLCDVTPERFSKIEKELVRGKSEITRRLHQLSNDMLQLEWLHEELDIPIPASDEPSPLASSSNLLPPSLHSSRCLSPDPFLASTPSTSTPTPCPRGRGLASPLAADPETSKHHSIFLLFLQRIYEAEAEGKAIDDSNAAIGLEGVEPTVGLMTWVGETKSELEDIKRRRETHIQTMYDQLEGLWKRLGITDAEIDEFVDNNRGSTEATVRSYEQELERMLELKRDRMSVFIGNARAEIEAFWDELMVSQEERADFAPFADDEHTEELLSIHEEEITRLKEERKKKAPILEKLRKYFEICEGEKELAAAAMDQSRLMGRGPRDPGRLLREEKMRKRVMREKPRLEQDLLAAIPAWEEEEDRPFLVNGVGVVDMLLEAASQHDKENAQRSKSRAGSVPPRATTPSENRPPEGRTTRAASSSNKRAKLANGPGARIPSSSWAAKETQHSLPHRAPFGSRAGALNMSTSSSMTSTTLSSDGLAPPQTTQKRNKTPATAVRRPASAAAKLHPRSESMASVQKTSGHRTGGFGYGRPPIRVVSASAATSKTYATINAGTMRGKARATMQSQPSRAVRSNRRESFRPRPSVDVGY